MKNICFYCKVESEVIDFQNQYSKEFHPTCKNCQNLINYAITTKKKLSKFAYLRFYGIPFFIICSIIAFTFSKYGLGIILIILALISGIVSYLGLEKFVKNKENDLDKKINFKELFEDLDKEYSILEQERDKYLKEVVEKDNEIEDMEETLLEYYEKNEDLFYENEFLREELKKYDKNIS